MDDDNDIQEFVRKIEDKSVGFEPMLLIAVIALLIIYYFIFSSLGNNEDGQASSLKVFFETMLWLLFIILLLLNGISYIFGIDIIKSVKKLFGYYKNEDDEDGDYEPEEKEKIIKSILKNQVFHLPSQRYNYDDASAACSAYGARLATFEELDEAQKNGADWCSYGWSDNQMALYPTQLEKWKRLQTMPGHEKECGRPGINGGYIKDSSGNFGVNCFGRKPNISRHNVDYMRNNPFIKKSNKEKYFDKKVDFWRRNLSQIEIAPFNHNNWSML